MTFRYCDCDDERVSLSPGQSCAQCGAQEPKREEGVMNPSKGGQPVHAESRPKAI